MTIDELEDLAFRKAPMPDLRSQAKCKLFLSFRNLYDYAERTKMKQDQGRQEKRRILRAFQTDLFLEEMQEETNKMWKEIEIAAAEYAKSPSIESADKLYTAIYGVKRKVLPEQAANEGQGVLP